MIFGLDGIELGLIIVFASLFSGIMSGFPVGFAIGGAAIISFGILAALDGTGSLSHVLVNTGSDEYAALVAEGVRPFDISLFPLS